LNLKGYVWHIHESSPTDPIIILKIGRKERMA